MPDKDEASLSKDDVETESLSLKSPVISYGADYTIESLAQYVKNDEIAIQPSFQRNFVWDIKKASKLIESFLLGYPVPNILLGRPQNDDRMEVIDGQQRIRSVTDFLKGTFNGEAVFRLTGDIAEQYSNKTYTELDEPDQRRLRNAIMKAIVLVYQENDPDLKYAVFQRINTGSIVLNQQEIRNCIYGGALNNLLSELNQNTVWRSYFSKKRDKRMRDEETILRFFAAYFHGEHYTKPMTSFLNKFMHENRMISHSTVDEWRGIFDRTIHTIAESYSGDNPFSLYDKKQFNRAISEAIMTGVAKLISEGKTDFSDFDEKHQLLIKNEDFIDSVSTGTSAERKYALRLELAHDLLK
jgi:uncharacterized protein with ParB-like and HNH nuclease domain